MERRTVMVVDDNGRLRRLVAGVLDELEALEVVEELASGQSVAAAVRRACPDVIVLDHEMPGGTGLSVLPRLRSECPRTRIVMWSSSADVAVVAIEMGADAAVGKHEPLEVLLSAVLA